MFTLNSDAQKSMLGFSSLWRWRSGFVLWVLCTISARKALERGVGRSVARCGLELAGCLSPLPSSEIVQHRLRSWCQRGSRWSLSSKPKKAPLLSRMPRRRLRRCGVWGSCQQLPDHPDLQDHEALDRKRGWASMNGRTRYIMNMYHCISSRPPATWPPPNGLGPPRRRGFCNIHNLPHPQGGGTHTLWGGRGACRAGSHIRATRYIYIYTYHSISYMHL